MAYNVNSCVSNLGNTGLSGCLDNLGMDTRLIWTPETFEFADQSTAETLSNWTDGIDAKNIYPLPLFDELDSAYEDDVEHDTPSGTSIFVREGKAGGIGRFLGALCDLPKLRTFNDVAGRAIIVTAEGKIYGTSPDGTKFKGFKLSKLHFSGIKGTDGSTPRFFELRYQFKSPNEMNDYPAVLAQTWDPLDLTGLIDVTVAVDSSAEGSVVLSVTRDCDGESVDGLVEGDFFILASDGSTQMLPADTFTDNGDGTYTFAFTTPVLPADTYTTNLKTPTSQTTGGYEGGTDASFVIS